MTDIAPRIRPTEPLRLEHLALLSRIHGLAGTADTVGDTRPAELRRALRDVHDFLALELVPHALAEEAALYPAVETAMGAPGATDTMRREHLEIRRLIEDLETASDELGPDAPDRPAEHELRRVLYGLHALIRAHFAKEEDVYLEILDARLDDSAATRLFERLEAAARQAKIAIAAPTAVAAPTRPLSAAVD